MPSSQHGPSIAHVVPESHSLHERLKTASWPAHARAHDLPFMLEIRKKRMSRAHYRVYLAQLYHVYRELEEGLEEHKDNNTVAQMNFPHELGRQGALERDLQFHYGPDWQTEITCLGATRRYVMHLRLVRKTRPELLVCHSYVRYMGDLAGGQIMKSSLQKSMHLPDSTGLEFNDFPNIDSQQKFKEFYFARLNALDIDEQAKQLMEDETTLGFELNVAMVEDIGRYVLEHVGPYVSARTPEDRQVALPRSHSTAAMLGLGLIPACIALHIAVSRGLVK